jgi:hypothetical protein
VRSCGDAETVEAMSAALQEPPAPPTAPSTATTTDPHSLAVIRTVLTRWGSICELARNWNGYPTSDTTHRAAFGRGGSGRKLPIPNIPSFATQMSEAVMQLPDDEGNAVTLWYCHHFNPDGLWLEAEHKALILGVCVRTMRTRVREGERLLLVRRPQVIDTWQAWVESQT